MVNNTTAIEKCTYMKATSDGSWTGEKPIDYALPLLIIQLCLVLFFSRVFAFILKPLRQPRVIAEILGGIILGQSVMGHIPGFTSAIFPPKSLTVLTTVANLGLLYYLFMIGLELDMHSLAKVGGPALGIAVAGISIPFAMGVGTSFAARSILGLSGSFGPFLVFMGVAMSITAFPVLARILAERRLLTTDVGQMAMSAAAVNDVTAWVLLALAIALSTPNAKATVVIWILLCGLAFVLVMLFVVRPFIAWMVRGVVANEPLPEWMVAVTLVGVVVAGFCTDTIGIHGIFGAFVFGLVIPKDGPFATLILEKLEDFTTIVLLPLYFASSGLSVNFNSLTSNSVGLIFLVLGTACVGKIGGTFVASLLVGVPMRKSVVLGILMNTKGLVELIVLNIGLTKKVINQELYTIMVVMALVTTFMTTPLVMLLYAPARDRRTRGKTFVETQGAADELRLLVCIHGTHNIPAVLNLTELFRGTPRKHPLRVFLMHLMELSERSSAVVMVTRVRKDGRPYWNKDAERRGQDQVVVAFQAYAELSHVNVVPLTSISAFDNMHEDICITADERRTSLIVMPYFKALNSEGEEVVNHNFLIVTRRLLRSAPCSVAILVDRGLGAHSRLAPADSGKRIAVLFFGGPDDREALSVGLRMAEHPGVSLTVLHFAPSPEAEIGLEVEQQQQQLEGASVRSPQRHEDLALLSFAVPHDKGLAERERKEDEEAIAKAESTVEPLPALVEDGQGAGQGQGQGQGQERQEGEAGGGAPRLRYERREVDDARDAILAVVDADFDLLLVGRARRPPILLASLASRFASHPGMPRPSSNFNLASGGGLDNEVSGWLLGPVGDLLASSNVRSSILVVQQHDQRMVHAPQNV